MDAVQTMAEHLAGVSYADLPGEVVQATKNDILDTIGTALAGCAAPGCAELLHTVVPAYSGGPASIWVYGHKVPPAEAALVNATMAHAFDFDDTHDIACLHAGISVIPAAFAVAEHTGGVSGKEFLAATALGVDWLCRMGLATTLPPIRTGWMYTALYAYFGAAASASKALGLGVDQIVNAMGIVYAHASGNNQCMTDGALSKRMQPGFGARAGVFSALLAKSGVTGARNVFDGTAGLYRVYLKGAYDRERLLSDLGRRFEGVNLSFKSYPSCRHTHTAIDATLDLVVRHDIDPDQIEEVAVGVNQEAYTNVCTPYDVKSNPRTVVDAQFSVPYCVATALTRKQVFIEEFAQTQLGNPAVAAIARKVKPFIDGEIEKAYSSQITPAVVSIKMRNGAMYSARKIFPRGGPEEPMSPEEIVAKFRRCAQYAGARLTREKVEGVIDMVSNLEAVRDVRGLVAMLA